MHLVWILAFWPVAAWTLQVTSPATNSTWDPSQSQTIEFNSVSTDPQSVNIVLVNQVVFPPVSITIASHVGLSGLPSHTVRVPAGFFANVTSQAGYQVNIVDPNTTGILAQSGSFSIEATNTLTSTVTSTTATSSASSFTTPSSTTASLTTTSATSTTTATNVAGDRYKAELGMFLAAAALNFNAWL